MSSQAETTRHALYQRGRTLQRLSIILTYIILVVVAFCILLPFIWLLSASLKNQTQYYAVPIQWIPQPFVWSNYVEAFTRYNFGRYVLNSVLLAIYAMVVNTLSSSLVAFGFARFRFPGRTLWFILMLSTLMLPSQVLTIPLYVIFRNLKWIDTFWPIIVPQLFGSAFNIFLFRQFFMELPKELDEAARIDGCSNLRIWWNIILPQSKPVIIVVAIFSFLASWRDAWNPLIYLSSQNNRTIPLGLLYFTDGYTSVYPQMMAATVIALAVPVLLYAIGQRYIDSGVAIAEIK
ncbi:multiple sugar transport system permease protein/sn-glycerol 3-phosphate transport system permease protein [Thermosporothrix hazakensis]|jgi:ABC-type glycerol-3-phosphate transport system permease component|uniref:Multiple sugar transport system permease protein/sn-glycerol 3-phosphate transport system permease protein n=2 Tax=Thermosporothrix TaxID=768650 RepID=A0A326UQK2_THEHA|nr:carbohydrate ABC transporter permease [Thermosporothrix hazakensis]PZW32767.1 multiple sugar transport system permease protein/sn-glycerol 3-phosphate transport system permease protein [Thermosporothrix hazakensis]BBH87682.1 sugar ABC transporter permease [Thermosporothrix sp. COM3]GCE50124.1 sugar ABC transporter permease [Thermosporothrix hazakensis]